MEWDKTSLLYVIYVGNAHKNNYDDFFKTQLHIKPIGEVGHPAYNITGLAGLLSVVGGKIDQCLLKYGFADIFGKNLFK
jgi:hypothetical protein